MPTWLVNSRMNPALAARVRASVSGRRQGTIPRFMGILRMGAILVGLSLVVGFWLSLQHESSQLELDRAKLLGAWSQLAASFPATDRAALVRINQAVGSLARSYPGDHIAEQLKTPGALNATLSRPLVYVRGSVAALSRPDGLDQAALESGKDSFLLCWLDPPTSRKEKALLPKARAALAGGREVELATPQVRRLYDAIALQPYLQPDWRERISKAGDERALELLARKLAKAPIQAAKDVANSEILVTIVDEPNDRGGVTELDGEHAHFVRISMLELGTKKPLLHLRRHVDPNWITPNRRSLYARELDSCRLAIDVRDTILGTETPSD